MIYYFPEKITKPYENNMIFKIRGIIYEHGRTTNHLSAVQAAAGD